MFGKNQLKSYRGALARTRGKSLVSAVPRKKSSAPGARPAKPARRPLPRIRGQAALLAAKSLWFAGCLALLAFAYLHGDMVDQEAVFVYGMIALTFPAGLLVAAGFSVFIKAVFYFFQLSVPSCFAFDLLMWPFFVLAGYLQWFIVPRRLFRRRVEEIDG